MKRKHKYSLPIFLIGMFITLKVFFLSTDSKIEPALSSTETSEQVRLVQMNDMIVTIADDKPKTNISALVQKKPIQVNTAVDGNKVESEVEHEFIEPTLGNADMLATGPFADEVNLSYPDNSCEDCIELPNHDMPASGDFADQVNVKPVRRQAFDDCLEACFDLPHYDMAATGPNAEQVNNL